MNYLNAEHEQRFHELMVKDHTRLSDKERQSLFYFLAGNRDLYQKKQSIYDLKNHCILPCLNGKGAKVDLSSGTKSLVILGFNLYNGNQQRRVGVCDIFSNLDEQNRRLALNAIQLRFM